MATILPHREQDILDNAENEKIYSFFDTLKVMVLQGPLNILLLCVPIAFISDYGLNDTSLLTFVMALLAIGSFIFYFTFIIACFGPSSKLLFATF